jgi:ectoine hydroxylase-related dioxygenase (phytanoyl-CoA dioxygenase family)
MNTEQIADDFYRDGFVHIPNVLEADEIERLRRRTDELMDDPELQARVNPERHDTRYVQTHAAATGEQLPFILRNTIELDPVFSALLVREPILGLAEAIVGKDCRFCGQNVLRNLSGIAIEQWHVDGALHFPLPEDVLRHESRQRPPVLWLTIQMALSDIDTIAHGPTQYIPGSHFSGRHPNDQQNPTFEGRGPVSILCKAGDIYLQDPQCWHRGAPNTSDRTRYLIQSQYAVDWAYRRFGWMNRVPVPTQVLQSASDRLLSVLGQQPS